jgi:hypothetical protein
VIYPVPDYCFLANLHIFCVCVDAMKLILTTLSALAIGAGSLKAGELDGRWTQKELEERIEKVEKAQKDAEEQCEHERAQRAYDEQTRKIHQSLREIASEY